MEIHLESPDYKNISLKESEVQRKIYSKPEANQSILSKDSEVVFF